MADLHECENCGEKVPYVELCVCEDCSREICSKCGIDTADGMFCELCAGEIE